MKVARRITQWGRNVLITKYYRSLTLFIYVYFIECNYKLTRRPQFKADKRLLGKYLIYLPKP